jgi:hypothetical protein
MLSVRGEDGALPASQGGCPFLAIAATACRSACILAWPPSLKGDPAVFALSG